VFAALLLLATTVALTLVMTVLHFATFYWYHGGRYPVFAYTWTWLTFYALRSVGNVLPCVVAGTILWLYRGTIAPSGFALRRLPRVAVYPASFLPLLTLAVPARLISTLFVYASRPNADWAIAFWWLVPNGRWSQKVYARMFDFEWFTSSFEWSHPLRVLTAFAIAALCVPLAFPRLRAAKLARTLGLVVLILLWPTTMVYTGWFVSLIVGAQRYLPGRRGWAVGLVSGAIGLLCLLVADTVLGGQALLDIVLVWP
jgi:hypothetical protein